MGQAEKTMQKISTTDASKSLGRRVKKVVESNEAIKIQYRNKEEAVLISKQRYEEISFLEDKLWAELADQAKQSGMLSVEKSQKLLDELLKS